MAVAVRIRYPGMTARDYDRLLLELRLDENPPAGVILHVAFEGSDGLDSVDVWQTPEAAAAFVTNRLQPTLRQLGIRTEPDFEILPLHNLYAPEVDTIERIGAVSLPGLGADAVL
jgi:hypothetical protein